MSLLATDAIVLHAIDYLESSRILRLATRDAGVLSVLARGARSSKKRFGSAVDLFAGGQVHVQTKPGRDLHTLVSFDVTRSRPQLAADLGRFSAASALSECVMRVVQEESAPRVFSGLSDGLDRIAEAAPSDTIATALGVFWRFVSDVGFAPMLDECAQCHLPVDEHAHSWFSHSSGGVLCDNCATAMPRGRRLPASARRNLRDWTAGHAVAVEPAAGRAHQRLLHEFLDRHLTDGRELKAFAIWELRDFA